MLILTFTAVLYAVELVNIVFGHAYDQFGIVPRTLTGLPGVVWAPLLHANLGHLIGNTVPVLLFGFLAMAAGIRRWFGVTALIWIIGGVGTWFIGDPHSLHIGASGLAFGWLAFLLVRGVFNGSLKQIVVAGVLFFYWGTMLWGVLPGQVGISWQGHLFGMIGGLVAAWVYASGSPAATSAVRRGPS